jgi:hypothetical protein
MWLYRRDGAPQQLCRLLDAVAVHDNSISCDERVPLDLDHGATAVGATSRRNGSDESPTGVGRRPS